MVRLSIIVAAHFLTIYYLPPFCNVVVSPDSGSSSIEVCLLTVLASLIADGQSVIWVLVWPRYTTG